MDTLKELVANPVAATFLMILLGFAVGKVQVRGLSLGASGVLFVALAFGQYELVKPEALGPISDLGVILFAYAIGLQAGPRFVATFRGRARAVLVIGLAMVIGSAAAALAGGWLVGLDGRLTVGIYAGAMTSTPALAAALDARKDPLISVAYGVAYPFGVVAVVLFAQIAPRILKSRASAAGQQDDAPVSEVVIKRTFRVENPGCVGKTISGMALHEMASVNVARILRGDEMLPASAEYRFAQGDMVLAVGAGSQLGRLEVLLGPAVDVDMDRRTNVVARDVFITERAVTGRPLGALQLPQRDGIVITRVRREGFELVPKGDFVLEVGDQVRAVGPEPEVLAFAKRAGIHERRIHETGMPSFALGIVLGLLVGLIEVPLPWGGAVKLGLAGGPLFVGLLFGHFGRIFGMRIHVPLGGRFLMRELGLLLFLAGAGASAGKALIPVLREQGASLIVLSIVVAVVGIAIGVVLAHGVFKQSAASTIGMTCGAMTSTPGLGAASAHFDSDAPALAYAAIYPLALVGVTVAAQVMAAMAK